MGKDIAITMAIGYCVVDHSDGIMHLRISISDCLWDAIPSTVPVLLLLGNIPLPLQLLRVLLSYNPITQ